MITQALERFGRMLEFEVTAGVLVIIVAGILGSVSPPRQDPSLLLSASQVQALLSPDLPTTAIVEPEQFYGGATRTPDDLRYSEFTHNWSGLMVCVLGLSWLGQGMAGRVGKFAARFWPISLLPFGIFIAIAADPEVWYLRKVSFAQVLSDPQLLEHQLGAGLVLILVWLGWRDWRRADSLRPLGYSLPVLMILGSLMLLGHAHTTLSAPDDLTNLINVQHAVLGALCLFAGTVRWFQLRQLVSQRIAGLAWPSLVVALGVFMALFYREVV